VLAESAADDTCCETDETNFAKGLIDNAILSIFSPLYSIYRKKNMLLLYSNRSNTNI
jgi:hypothetical protein